MGRATGHERARLLEAQHYLHVGVRASEEWQPSYKHNRSTFRALLALEAELETQVSEYLYEAADRVQGYVDWSRMPKPIQATADPVENNDSEAWAAEQVLLAAAVSDVIAELIATGGKAGELTYGITVGMNPLHAEVLKAARLHVAQLVSQVTETTRDLIRESIKQSIDRGENITKSVERLKKVINNPVRAELIARTESVNSYQLGLRRFAGLTGAVSKTWESLLGACVICSPLNGKTILIDERFVLPNGNEVEHPSAHPRCRCSCIYLYSDRL